MGAPRSSPGRRHSTGSIISAGTPPTSPRGTCTGSTPEQHVVRRRRSVLWPLARYRYPPEPLEDALRDHLGDGAWATSGGARIAGPVITAFDLVANRTRFIKPWKREYAEWPVRAVMASCTVPPLPRGGGRYIDGGVGSHQPLPGGLRGRPLPTGTPPRRPSSAWAPAGRTRCARRRLALLAVGLIGPVGAFLGSADEQQVHLVCGRSRARLSPVPGGPAPHRLRRPDQDRRTDRLR